MVYINTQHRPAGLIEGNFELAFLFPEEYDPKTLKGLFGELPSLDSLAGEADVPLHSRGVLRAVDPIAGKIVWEQRGSDVWDGGVMSTGGNLVFRGDTAGFLNVYSADSGQLLNRIDVGTSIMAAPMTYRVQGEQYVAVMAGYGGGLLNAPFPPDSAALKYGNEGRIVAFRLGGRPVPKPSLVAEAPFPDPPPREGTPAQIAQGEVLYSRFCSRCHVLGRGTLPDLRRMSPMTHVSFYEIVLNGAYEAKGMARWDDVLTRSDAGAIHAYLVNEAWRAQDTMVHRHEQ
jgi:quinohemoprotein ethanol dehydrogenase